MFFVGSIIIAATTALILSAAFSSESKVEMIKAGIEEVNHNYFFLVLALFITSMPLNLYLLTFMLIFKLKWLLGYIGLSLVLGISGISHILGSGVVHLIFSLVFLVYLLQEGRHKTASAALIVSLLLSTFAFAIFFSIYKPTLS